MQPTTDATFNQDISKGLVLVDIWAPWCGPCKTRAPMLDELSVEMGDVVHIMKLNADENQGVCEQLGIMQLPTLALYRDGKPVGRTVGARSKVALREFVESALVS
jgi:thioredoxin 1